MKRCSNCGSENRRNAVFCSSCGFKLNSGRSSSWWKKQSQTSKFLIAAGLPTIIILFIAVAAMVSTDYSTDYSDDSSYDSLEANGAELTDSPGNKFQGNGISFSYPETWSISPEEEGGSDAVVSLESYKGGVSSIMTVYKKPGSLDAETLRDIWLEVCYENGDIVEDVRELEVDGNRAYSIKSSYYSEYGYGEQEYIAFTDGIYEYSLLFTSDDISLIQDDIDTIIRSFRVE